MIPGHNFVHWCHSYAFKLDALTAALFDKWISKKFAFHLGSKALASLSFFTCFTLTPPEPTKSRNKTKDESRIK